MIRQCWSTDCVIRQPAVNCRLFKEIPDHLPPLSFLCLELSHFLYEQTTKELIRYPREANRLYCGHCLSNYMPPWHETNTNVALVTAENFDRTNAVIRYLLRLINPLAPELFFFLILAHPVYKMWIIQEPNRLALWNKLHFEEKETESIEHV